MKVGSLIYATEQGLGRLARSFVDAGVVTDPVVVIHPRHPTQNWYGCERVPIRASYGMEPAVRRMLERVDVVLFFETPFDWSLFRRCREMRKKSFLMTMYECTPAVMPVLPDVFLCPSRLDLQYFEVGETQDAFTVAPFTRCRGTNGPDAYLVDVPVSVPWRQRERAEVFVHNAGNGSFRDRNGTSVVLEAWKHVRSPAKLLLRTQQPLTKLNTDLAAVCRDKRIEVYSGNWPYETLWDTGDVFLFPERFNGLSLPLQEACAAGMLVMAGNRFPVNTWLPPGGGHRLDSTDCPHGNDPRARCTCPEVLIPVDRVQRARIGPPYNEFDEAVYTPQAVAAKVDEWYGKDIRMESYLGKVWAETMTWERLKPKYLEVLSS